LKSDWAGWTGKHLVATGIFFQVFLRNLARKKKNVFFIVIEKISITAKDNRMVGNDKKYQNGYSAVPQMLCLPCLWQAP
jgi:hypothetical protein